MKMKKILLALLSVLLVSGMLALTACGGGGGGTDDKDPGTKDPGITDDEEEIATFTVTFETNGGGSLDAVTVEDGSVLSLSNSIVPKPEDGKYFAGWYKDAGLTELWDIAYEKVTANVTLYAKWGVIEDIFEWQTLTDGNIIIHSIFGTDKVIAIPEEIENKKVTNIYGEGGFDNSDLITVIVPDSLIYIYPQNFITCSSVTSVLVSNNHPNFSSQNGYLCNKVGDTLRVFPQGKKDLSDLPDSIATIGRDAFYYVKSLTSITIPDTVKSIGACSFEGCTSLSEVYLPASVPELVTDTGKVSATNLAFNYNAPDRKFYVPAGSLADYQNSESWTNYIDSFVELSE